MKTLSNIKIVSGLFLTIFIAIGSFTYNPGAFFHGLHSHQNSDSTVAVKYFNMAVELTKSSCVIEGTDASNSANNSDESAINQYRLDFQKKHMQAD